MPVHQIFNLIKVVGHLVQFEEKKMVNEITTVSSAALCLKDSGYIDSLQTSAQVEQENRACIVVVSRARQACGIAWLLLKIQFMCLQQCMEPEEVHGSQKKSLKKKNPLAWPKPH